MMVTFDLETTNHSYGSALDSRNYVLMVCWQVDDGPVKFHKGGLLTAREFWADVDAADTLLCHNAKFEMHWFTHYGKDIDKWHWHDTMLAERVIAGNRPWKFSLGAVAERYGEDTKDPVIDSMMKAGVCPSEMPQKRLKARCVRDVRTTYGIFQRQLATMRGDNLLHLYRTRCDFCVVLAHMEANGMYLDRERVMETYYDTAVEFAGVSTQLDEMTGGINLRSTDQLAHYLYGELGFPERKGASGKPLRNKPSKQFPKGKPKTDAGTLMWLAKQAKTDEQRAFIELRQKYGQLNADLSKNLEFFKGVVEENGEHFHSQFNQTVAATHRLSSSGVPLQFKQFDKPKSVQLQNSPRKFKRLYRAPEDGWHVVEVDAAQLEFRVAAFCGQDEQAMLDIADPNFDAHCRSASVMNDYNYRFFLKQYREGQLKFKAMRQEAKADTFKPLYGGTRGTPEQEKWYKAFQDRYSELYATQEAWVSEVAREGTLLTPWGMRFYWHGTYNRRGVLIDTASNRPLAPQIFNYPIQSLATAEMMPLAICLLYKACKERGLNVKFVNTIHDSVIAYVLDGELDAYHELAKWAFTEGLREALALLYTIDFNVPLGCGFTAGKHWGEGDEIIFDEVEQ